MCHLFRHFQRFPLPPPGQNSENIKISMNQLGLNNEDDINKSSLTVRRMGQVVGSISNTKSTFSNSLPGGNNTPIVISTPAIYNFTFKNGLNFSWVTNIYQSLNRNTIKT